MQKDQLPKKNIREIQPNPFLVQKRLGKKLRVAAYCRVSTAQEEQELSFESQVAYYTNLIENNPEWELVEIFADHGISGTKDTTRPGFNISGANGYDESYMVEYEEGIYIGYRYYETAAADGAIDYDTAVVYPFGYGLSYASFAQEITGVTEEDGKINVSVKVTNTQPADGFSGKDVVQVYYHAPYDGTVEKAEVVLAAYDKTDLLAPGESQEMTLTFDRQDMASYDYKNEGCYVLDAGTYTLSLRKNSHELYGDNCT